MGVRPKELKPKETETKKPRKGEAVYVKTDLTPQQQLDYLTHLSLAALDIGLETGFKDGPMRDKGGALSITAKRIGAMKDNGKTPIMKQSDAMYEVDFEAGLRAKRRGKGQMEKKMRRLMRSIMAGKAPSPTSRRNYFSFGKGKSTAEAILLAKEAKKILESAGFEVLHKPGTRGIHIVGFAKNAGSTVASLQKYVRKKAMQEVAAYKKRQQIGGTAEREAIMAKRRKTMKELFQAVESGETVAYQHPPDPKFDEEFRQKLKEKDPEEAAERILTIIAKPMTQDFDQYELQFLLKRKDVVETLHFYYPFVLFTNQEYKSYVSFMKGEKRGAVAIRTPGRKYYKDIRARQRQGRGPVKPWNAIMENTKRLAEGKKAVFIRSSYDSAVQTIAELERMFPGRSVFYERSPESILAGGGIWTITVAARGKKAPPTVKWYQKSFKDQIRLAAISKDKSFRLAVIDALAGGRSKPVEFNNQTVPRWMSSMIDRKKSTQNTLVLKEEYWRKFESKGISVLKVIRGTPVYKTDRDKKKGNVWYHSFEFTLSGEKFAKQLKLARAKVEEKYGPKLKEVTFESKTEVAQRKPPLKKRVAERISAMRKEQKERFAMRAKKKKGSKEV